jgi:hypothetical protein
MTSDGLEGDERCGTRTRPRAILCGNMSAGGKIVVVGVAAQRGRTPAFAMLSRFLLPLTVTEDHTPSLIQASCRVNVAHDQ